MHVRASSGFANRVQIKPPEFGLEFVYRGKMCRPVTQPFGQTRLRRC
jgi:hypothetical protein